MCLVISAQDLYMSVSSLLVTCCFKYPYILKLGIIGAVEAFPFLSAHVVVHVYCQS
jgi:hypothetical protein